MPNAQSSEALLSMFDSAPLNRRYWTNFSLLALITVLEFFDFLVVGFLVAVLGPQWQLTYGQSAIILYSGGVGAICGAIIWGRLAAATSAALMSSLGWRGVAMLGALTVPVGVVIWFVVPESVRWLAAKGRFAQARAQLAQQLDLPLERVPLPTQPPMRPPTARFSELYRSRRRFWETVIIWGGSSTAAYGVYLWGPTIVALLLGIDWKSTRLNSSHIPLSRMPSSACKK